MDIRRAVIAVVTITSFLCVQGRAQPGRGPFGFGHRPMAPRRVFAHLPGEAYRIVVAGIPYWVCAGVYYQLVDDGYVIVPAPVVGVLPSHHTVVVIHGVAYYVADDVYYRTAPGGYVVAEKPVETAKVATAPEGDSTKITLYVPKKNSGGFTPVTLKKIEGGLLGPQGEFYPSMPPVALLSEMYGIPEEQQQGRSDTFSIHVPNKDGESFTRVTLTRHKGGFLGPQGEFYPIMPSVAHLAEMYGVSKEPAKTEDTVVHIQVPKKTGEGTVDVELRKHDQGYLGPQGEFYPQMPSPAQLSEMYGAR